jgi:hypothetical protein
MEILAIVGSIVIPLVIFMFTLRPWIKDTVKLCLRDSEIELTKIRSELKAYREGQKEFIELYKLIGNLKNPHPDKGVLLDKLKNDTITREEAILLQSIMSGEKTKAEETNDILKAIVIIGILALITYTLSNTK